MIGSPDLSRVTDLTRWYLPPASFLRVSRDLKDMPVSGPEITLAEASNRAEVSILVAQVLPTRDDGDHDGGPQWSDLPSHYWLRASAYGGQAQLADVYIDDFGHVARVGQSELESGEGPDVDFTRRVDDFYAKRQIPQSVHKAVRSEVACGAQRSAASMGRPLLRRACCLCGLLWVAGGAT